MKTLSVLLLGLLGSMPFYCCDKPNKSRNSEMIKSVSDTTNNKLDVALFGPCKLGMKPYKKTA